MINSLFEACMDSDSSESACLNDCWTPIEPIGCHRLVDSFYSFAQIVHYTFAGLSILFACVWRHRRSEPSDELLYANIVSAADAPSRGGPTRWGEISKFWNRHSNQVVGSFLFTHSRLNTEISIQVRSCSKEWNEAIAAGHIAVRTKLKISSYRKA